MDEVDLAFENSYALSMQQPGGSNAASEDSFMTCRTEPIICFSSQPAHSNISFSGVTGESNAGEIQDCRDVIDAATFKRATTMVPSNITGD
ncbi:hypothetical protein Bca52824_019566 [Brassica carinata]|uniref:Uncharacterized protein n=1 Tax=Brassica carinata TaxID=52824 RepID=A0A8X7VS07_BRACI|nr:hypothetical protein Bca52824_019566 [Brassica carinata]